MAESWNTLAVEARLNAIQNRLRDIQRGLGTAPASDLQALWDEHADLTAEYGRLALVRDKERRPEMYAFNDTRGDRADG